NAWLLRPDREDGGSPAPLLSVEQGLLTSDDHAAPPEVSAIIVNWNTRDLLAGCLRSLQAYGPVGRRLETIVVDNGFHDGSADMVRQEWPDVQVIRNTENEGFTRANNRAIRASHGAYLLLINADALLTPDCLDRMLARMEADPKAGAVGPRL